MGRRKEHTAHLYMDGSSPTLARRRAVVERCEELVDAGALARYSVRTWPRRVVLDGPNGDVSDVYDRFRRWAAAEGVSLGPAFERHPHDQRITDERGELLTLPAVAIALFEDGRLVQVAPHTRGEEPRTVDDVLDGLLEPTPIPQ